MRDYIVTVLGVPYSVNASSWLRARYIGCTRYLRDHPASSYNITRLINAGKKKVQVRVAVDERIKFGDFF